MNYNDINDYEVLYLINNGNPEYKDILFNKYKYLIINVSNKLSLNSKIDFDDAYVEALIGFNTAISLYDYKSNTSFSTFATSCMKKTLSSYKSSYQSSSNIPLNNYISFDSQVDSEHTLKDYLASSDDLFDMVVSDTSYDEVNKFKYKLDPITSSIFTLNLCGFKSREIAELLGISYDNVCYKIKAIRKRIANLPCFIDI